MSRAFAQTAQFRVRTGLWQLLAAVHHFNELMSKTNANRAAHYFDELPLWQRLVVGDLHDDPAGELRALARDFLTFVRLFL